MARSIKSIDELASDVATVLGENIARDLQPEESGIPLIRERVRAMAPGILTELLMEWKPEEIDESNPITAEPMRDETGIVTLTLPDDFLRLVAVRMTDWDCTLYEITGMDNTRTSRERNGRDGAGGNPERPVALMDHGRDGRRRLRLYRSKAGSEVGTALYLPMPAINHDDTLWIPQRLYHRLMMRLAETIRKEA